MLPPIIMVRPRKIWEQTDGVVYYGSIQPGYNRHGYGISKRLKELNPEIKIIGVEPYLQHKIQGLKNMRESYRPEYSIKLDSTKR